MKCNKNVLFYKFYKSKNLDFYRVAGPKDWTYVFLKNELLVQKKCLYAYFNYSNVSQICIF